ncbi:unnamed protein product [Clavelina lepadiformis]|uniref:Uncharacterized protein n=1 Tax=Clavelina lepadiformis TaxID=159417 RepID=A0ABP0G4E5_CLALP
MPTQQRLDDILRQHSDDKTDILDFSNCQMSPYQADQICNYLKDHGVKMRNQKLNFYNCGMTSKTFSLIAEAICSLPYQLQEIDLRKNKLKKENIYDIISVLARTVSLVDLRGAFKDDGRPENAIESEGRDIKRALQRGLCIVVDNRTILGNIPVSTVITQYQAMTDGRGNYYHTTCTEKLLDVNQQSQLLPRCLLQEDILTKLSLEKHFCI